VPTKFDYPGPIKSLLKDPPPDGFRLKLFPTQFATDDESCISGRPLLLLFFLIYFSSLTTDDFPFFEDIVVFFAFLSSCSIYSN
jgi:hypothetical protein